jgi:hypothetical protein
MSLRVAPLLLWASQEKQSGARPTEAGGQMRQVIEPSVEQSFQEFVVSHKTSCFFEGGRQAVIDECNYNFLTFFMTFFI